MPKLRLTLNGNLVKEYELVSESLTIGRRNTNDVAIADLGVSRYHARIDVSGNKILLTDLDSKNGTFVNDRPISSHLLTHGDVIRIGKHNFLFSNDDLNSQPVMQGAAPAETVALKHDNSRFFEETPHKTPSRETKEEVVAVVSFLAGGTGEVEINKKLIKVGKDPFCDLVVSGFQVGRIAFTISQRPSGHYLSYVGGFSKPKVNGQAVRQSMKLEEFDVIEIGSARLQFFYRADSKGA